MDMVTSFESDNKDYKDFWPIKAEESVHYNKQQANKQTK